MKLLRPYQERGVADIRACFGRGVRSVLFQAPTGSGKTVLFAYIVAGAMARGNKVVIIGHRDEIVRQVSAALVELDVAHGIIAAGYDETPAPVQIANIATLVRRLDQLAPPDFIVTDEAHRRHVARNPGAVVTGEASRRDRDARASRRQRPARRVRRARHRADGWRTDRAKISLSVHNIRAGASDGDFAVDQLGQAMSKGIVVDGAVDEYARICSGVPVIVFCVDIAHSELVAERFAARGFRAAHVDGDTPADQRRDLIAALGTGKIQVLCNCGLISEGLDVPSVVAVILLRPTKSLTLYLQQVGRALRPAEGKARALILDHSGNTFRFGMVDAPRTWSLEGRPKGEREGVAPVCRCAKCGALNPIAAFLCVNCGT